MRKRVPCWGPVHGRFAKGGRHLLTPIARKLTRTNPPAT